MIIFLFWLIFWLLIAVGLVVWYVEWDIQKLMETSLYECEGKCCNPEKRIDEEDRRRGGL